MGTVVQDRANLPVDLLLANATSDRATGGPSAPTFAARAVHLLGPGALVISPTAPHGQTLAGVEVLTVPGAAEWALIEGALVTDLAERLRTLERPVRFLAARWSNAAVELVERLEADGVPISRELVPTVLGGTVHYWNTKIGTSEVLQAIPGVRGHLPPSTVVASPAEAIAVATSYGGPAVLKANDAIGGIGIVALDDNMGPSEIQERLQATTQGSGAGKKALVDLDGPYVLQGVVGSDASWSPSLDFLVQPDDAACIAAAEQVLDGYQYRGARFPGQSDSPGIERCANLGILVADRLRQLGYRGLLNLDFVVDGNEAWLIELNARQSAPLDQSLRTTAAFGTAWRQSHGFELLEVDGALKWR